MTPRSRVSFYKFRFVVFNGNDCSGLEKELDGVNKNVNSLSKSGDEFAEQEDQIADQISTLKQR